MNLPRYTKEIFERLSKGNFICQNSPEPFEKRLYDICEQNVATLESYFEPIGFELQYGSGYFYFSKELQEIQIEAKLDNILHLIDYIEMFLQYDEYFDVGWRGGPVSLAQAATDNVVIKERIDKIRGLSGNNLFKRCEDIFVKMRKDGYMALENEYEKRYVVLTSYGYLVDFFKNVKEVDVNESA